MYNKIWSLGVRPQNWNKSNVIPIPKKVKILKPDDTRPINLINSRIKIFDKMVNARLIHLLEANKIISTNQFGFRKNKQTLDSLINLSLHLEKELRFNNHTQIISFDIKKAFDKIWPSAILDRLQNYGIGGRMYRYVQEYLGVRSFIVSNGYQRSDEVETDLGVPQGSPLSSTLFIIAFQHLIEPIQERNEVQFSAYADDLIIYSSRPRNLENTIVLQKTIKCISKIGMSVGLQFLDT